MNGPEHYREAEKLLDRADTARADVVPTLVAMAQVHATLAAVVATISDQYGGISFAHIRDEWTEATA